MDLNPGKSWAGFWYWYPTQRLHSVSDISMHIIDALDLLGFQGCSGHALATPFKYQGVKEFHTLVCTGCYCKVMDL